MAEQMVSVPLSVAKLIRAGCLPFNERKMRGADPELVKAITEFKRAIATADIHAK